MTAGRMNPDMSLTRPSPETPSKTNAGLSPNAADKQLQNKRKLLSLGNEVIQNFPTPSGKTVRDMFDEAVMGVAFDPQRLVAKMEAFDGGPNNNQGLVNQLSYLILTDLYATREDNFKEGGAGSNYQGTILKLVNQIGLHLGCAPLPESVITGGKKLADYPDDYPLKGLVAAVSAAMKIELDKMDGVSASHTPRGSIDAASALAGVKLADARQR